MKRCGILYLRRSVNRRIGIDKNCYGVLFNKDNGSWLHFVEKKLACRNSREQRNKTLWSCEV